MHQERLLNLNYIPYGAPKAVKKPISKKALLASLTNYFGEENEMASDVGQYILESREETIKEGIRRK